MADLNNTGCGKNMLAEARKNGRSLIVGERLFCLVLSLWIGVKPDLNTTGFPSGNYANLWF